MGEQIGLAVYGLRRAAHPPARFLHERLMPEAYAEQVELARSALDQFQAAAGALWPARTGRQHDQRTLGLGKRYDVGCLHPVAEHRHRTAEPLERFDEVEAEAVQIVDQDHAAA